MDRSSGTYGAPPEGSQATNSRKLSLMGDVDTSASEPKVLIVDDDEDLSGLMGEYLGQHGCHIEVASDGQSGLARAVAGGHDLVILDVMLPVLDGFEVLRQLRRRSLVPVIML